MNLDSLLSTTVNNCFKIIHDNDPKANAEQHKFQHGSNPLMQGGADDDSGLGKYLLPGRIHNCEEGIDVAYEYNGTFAHMIVDAIEDVRLEDCVAKSICGDAFNSTIKGEQTTTSFCPSRKPHRSSLKRSGTSQRPSPFSTKPSQSGTLGDTFQILLPGRVKPIERRRTIRFDSKIDLLSIEPVRVLAIDGPSSLWYQESEYEAIKFKTLALLDRVDHSSGIIDGKKYCTRGLEKFMTPETTEVKKHQAWDSVLNEQFLQRKDGEFDEETLANIYKYSTNRSKKEALKRAKLDAEASEAYLQTNFRIISSNDGIDIQINFDRRVSM